MHVLIFLFLLSQVACNNGETYPHGNPGEPFPNTRMPDAQTKPELDGGVSDGGIENRIQGTICIIEDLRTPEICSQRVLAKGIKIQIGNSDIYTFTSETGAFSLPVPKTKHKYLRIAFNTNAYKNIIFPLPLKDGELSDLTIGVIENMQWTDLLSFLGTAAPPGTASIVTYVRKNNIPEEKVTVIAPQGTLGIPFYDNIQSKWLSGIATGKDAAVLILGVPSLQQNVSFTTIEANGSTLTVTEIPVEENALTMVWVDLP